MITFVHIGLPKTLSSALQREFFPHHPSIHYLGIGQGGAIEWIDSDIQLIFDDLLVYARDGYWQSRRDWAKEVVARQLSQAGKAGKKAVGLSSEWLSVTLSPDMIDNRVKVERLLDLFGEEVRVIYFLRNQFDLLKSLYGQYVREGLALTFESFLDYIHDFRDRSIFFELCYETTVRQFSEAFGRSRVSAIPIERFKETSGELRTDDQGRICLVDEMCRVLKIEYPAGFCLPKVNPSLSDIELYHKFSLNREYPHDFGRGYFEPANRHRCRSYLESVGAVGAGDVFGDVRIKRLSLEKSRALAASEPVPISHEAKSEVIHALKEAFEASNQRLEEVVGAKLPPEYFDLRF